MIIDCHIHPAIDANSNVCRFLDPGDFGRQVKALRRAGIGRACGSIVLKGGVRRFAQIRKLNDTALRLRDAFPRFYVPGIQVDPRFEQESCKEIERLAGEGVKWVGELVGGLFGYGENYTSPSFLAIMRQVSKAGMVVNIHCGNPGVMKTLAKAMPALKFVLAHPGDGDNFTRRMELVAAHSNLYLDLSGTGIDRYGMLRRAIDMAGKRKILFGSDYPVNNPAVYVHAVRFEPLTNAERQEVFQDNFLRLIGE
jgi:predicted TIM-barrel fold metal-dependent hydrolase